MNWLLEQGEHLPAIVSAVVISVIVSRFLFARREDVESLKAKQEDLERSDSQHMAAVGRAHTRIDDWTRAHHVDIVRLFEMAHDHERKDP